MNSTRFAECVRNEFEELNITPTNCNWVEKSINPINSGEQDAAIYSICCNNTNNCNYIVKHIFPSFKKDETKWKEDIKKELDINNRYPRALKPLYIFGCYQHGVFIVYEKRQATLEEYIIMAKNNKLDDNIIKDQINKVKDLFLKETTGIIYKAQQLGLFHNDTTKRNIMVNMNPDSTINLDSVVVIDFGLSKTEYNDNFKEKEKEITEVKMTFNGLLNDCFVDAYILKLRLDDYKRKIKEDKERKNSKKAYSRFNSSMSIMSPSSNSSMSMMSPSSNSSMSMMSPSSNTSMSIMSPSSKRNIMFNPMSSYDSPPRKMSNFINLTPSSDNFTPIKSMENLSISTSQSKNTPSNNGFTPIKPMRSLLSTPSNNGFTPISNKKERVSLEEDNIFSTPQKNKIEFGVSSDENKNGNMYDDFEEIPETPKKYGGKRKQNNKK